MPSKAGGELGIVTGGRLPARTPAFFHLGIPAGGQPRRGHCRAALLMPWTARTTAPVTCPVTSPACVIRVTGSGSADAASRGAEGLIPCLVLGLILCLVLGLILGPVLGLIPCLVVRLVVRLILCLV